MSGSREETRPGLAPVPDSWPCWDGSSLPPSDTLRWGYTTGACAAGVLTASWLARLSGKSYASVALLFGDGAVRTLPLSPELPDYPGFAVIRKNGGDDPDCTHGVLVAGRLRPCQDGDLEDERDIDLIFGHARVRLRCLEGVGLCTRTGLDCSQGHWAVNAGVLAMIKANLERAGLSEGNWTAELVLPEGRALAARTLNKTLGIESGLSLLGTTGLVRPFSHESYMATVRVCLRSAASIGFTAVLCTGRRTMQAARDWALDPDRRPLLGPLDDASFISVADFIGESLRAACTFPLKRVLVCCMPGKLLKYASGADNTHARRQAQDMGLLARGLENLFPARPELASLAQDAPSMRAAMDLLGPDETAQILENLASTALAQFLRQCGQTDRKDNNSGTRLPAFGLLVTDFAGLNSRLYPGPGFLSF